MRAALLPLALAGAIVFVHWSVTRLVKAPEATAVARRATTECALRDGDAVKPDESASRASMKNKYSDT